MTRHTRLPTPERRKAESKARARRIHEMLVSPVGQELMALLRENYRYGTVHTPGDPYSTAFKDGQRSVVEELIVIEEMEATYDDEDPEIQAGR